MNQYSFLGDWVVIQWYGKEIIVQKLFKFGNEFVCLVPVNLASSNLCNQMDKQFIKYYNLSSKYLNLFYYQINPSYILREAFKCNLCKNNLCH